VKIHWKTRNWRNKFKSFGGRNQRKGKGVWRFTEKPKNRRNKFKSFGGRNQRKGKRVWREKRKFTENSQFIKVIFYKNIKFCFLLIVVERVLRRKGGRSMMSLKKWVMTRSKWSKENSFKEKYENKFEVIKRNYLGKIEEKLDVIKEKPWKKDIINNWRIL